MYWNMRPLFFIILFRSTLVTTSNVFKNVPILLYILELIMKIPSLKVGCLHFMKEEIKLARSFLVKF
jgi:hypothetical protein